MLPKEPLDDAYRCLGLTSAASLLEVNRAYRESKALYDENSLASYSLLDAEERAARLEKIEQAYRRISSECATARPVAPVAAAPRSEPAPVPAQIAYDPAEQPGPFIRRCREARGLSIREVAETTKIGSMYLEDIEAHRFDRLPARVYLRGFLVEIGRLLGIDRPDELSRRFLAALQQAEER